MAVRLGQGGRDRDRATAGDPNRLAVGNGGRDEAREDCGDIHLVLGEVELDAGKDVGFSHFELDVHPGTDTLHLHPADREDCIRSTLRVPDCRACGMARVRNGGQQPGRAGAVDDDEVLFPDAELGADGVDGGENCREVAREPGQRHHLLPVGEGDEGLFEADGLGDGGDAEDRSGHGGSWRRTNFG